MTCGQKVEFKVLNWNSCDESGLQTTDTSELLLFIAVMIRLETYHIFLKLKWKILEEMEINSK